MAPLIAAILLAGCIEPPVSDRSAEINQVQAGSGRVEAHEKQCASDAVQRSDAAIAQVVSTPGAIDQQMQAVVDERNRQLAQCETDADRANDQLSEGERSDYEREAEEQRQRTAMAIIVTSQP